jgi:predicted transcriptional regulator
MTKNKLFILRSACKIKIWRVIMKASMVKTLDDRDREFAMTLQKLGVQQNVAAMITYLMSVDKATSREIEIGTDLRQPEVSICAKILRHDGWLEESDIKRGGKDRPLRVYKLKVSIDEIIKHFEEERIQESAEIMQSIQKLKQLSSS